MTVSLEVVDDVDVVVFGAGSSLALGFAFVFACVVGAEEGDACGFEGESCGACEFSVGVG